MSTAETITAIVALTGALGAGALLKSWLDHSLSRRDREASLNERSVKVAEALMTRLEAALAKAQEENEALRAELNTRHDDIDGEKVRRVLADLAQLLGEIDTLQGVQHRQIRDGLDRSVGPVRPHQ
jgi:hypothetical protein